MEGRIPNRASRFAEGGEQARRGASPSSALICAWRPARRQDATRLGADDRHNWARLHLQEIAGVGANLADLVTSPARLPATWAGSGQTLGDGQLGATASACTRHWPPLGDDMSPASRVAREDAPVRGGSGPRVDFPISHARSFEMARRRSPGPPSNLATRIPESSLPHAAHGPSRCPHSPKSSAHIVSSESRVPSARTARSRAPGGWLARGIRSREVAYIRHRTRVPLDFASI